MALWESGDKDLELILAKTLEQGQQGEPRAPGARERSKGTWRQSTRAPDPFTGLERRKATEDVLNSMHFQTDGFPLQLPLPNLRDCTWKHMETHP